MGDNSRKHEGFTLLEVIISMALISIISVGVYNAYLLIIRQTKEGQVKQSAALEGKKMIEQLQAIEFNLPNSKNGDLTFNIGGIELKKKSAVDGDTYIRYLDNNYNYKDTKGNDISEKARKYTELVTITPTEPNGEKTTFDNKQTNESTSKCIIYMGKESLGEYIADNVNEHEPNNLPSQTEDGSKKIVIYVYITKITSQNKENIEIKDCKGEHLLSMTNDISNDLYINLSGYKEASDAIKKDEIQVNIYNKVGSTQNIYLEKTNDINVNVKACKGEINIYDNRASNEETLKVGTLYNIKVEIRDYKKDIDGEIKEDKDNLFTGYSKKNIQQ